MSDTRVTLTLPLTEQGLNVVLVALLIAILTFFIWLAMDGAERRSDSDPAASALQAFGWVYAPIWLLVLAGTLWALWLVFSGDESSPLAAGGAGSLGLGALIAALLGAPFVIWGTVLKHQTVMFQKEGHMTDRINKAVEQLGAEKTTKYEVRYIVYKRRSTGERAFETRIQKGELPDLPEDILDQQVSRWQAVEETVPNIEVRIGAILSLERIAQDSARHDSGRDHVRVMEILCAYIRENAPAESASDLDFPKECHEGEIDVKLKANPYKWLYSLDGPRSDVQLALSVIGRRSQRQIEFEQQYRDGRNEPYTLDLSRCNLRKANIEGLNFSNASFYKSEMQSIFCKGATLVGCNFIYAQMTGIRANDVDFSGSKIDASDFSYGDCAGADFSFCGMSHTHFVRTGLNRAIFYFQENKSNHKVNRVFFVNADIKESLIKGDLVGCVFQFDKNEGEDYPHYCGRVKFRSARLGAKFAFLGEARTQMSYNSKWLDIAFGDGSVVLPEEVAWPQHWPKIILDTNSFDIEYKKWLANPENYLPSPKPD